MGPSKKSPPCKFGCPPTVAAEERGGGEHDESVAGLRGDSTIGILTLSRTAVRHRREHHQRRCLSATKHTPPPTVSLDSGPEGALRLERRSRRRDSGSARARPVPRGSSRVVRLRGSLICLVTKPPTKVALVFPILFQLFQQLAVEPKPIASHIFDQHLINDATEAHEISR